MVFFFFRQKTAYEMRISDWSSDVCSSDLEAKVRIVVAGLFVLASKGVQVSMGFLYGAAIDRMAPGMEGGVALAIGLVLAYAGARFAGVLFDNLRNVVFERVGQDATRELAITTFSHLHALSLRFHLARRTGEVTKVIERGRSEERRVG